MKSYQNIDILNFVKNSSTSEFIPNQFLSPGMLFMPMELYIFDLLKNESTQILNKNYNENIFNIDFKNYLSPLNSYFKMLCENYYRYFFSADPQAEPTFNNLNLFAQEPNTIFNSPAQTSDAISFIVFISCKNKILNLIKSQPYSNISSSMNFFYHSISGQINTKNICIDDRLNGVAILFPSKIKFEINLTADIHEGTLFLLGDCDFRK